jgi:hypothetical protein
MGWRTPRCPIAWAGFFVNTDWATPLLPHYFEELFALFAGEEVGLAGSGAFVNDPPFPLDHTVAMINFDMVGRLRDDQLMAFGTDSAAEWEPVLAPLGAELGLKLKTVGDGYGPSDQTSFYAARVPVLHFFTGAHEEYHTPDDAADTVNMEGGGRIAELGARLGRELASGRLNPLERSAIIDEARRKLEDVTDFLVIAEADPFDDASSADVETGDYALGKYGAISRASRRCSSSARPLMTPATPVVASAARSAAPLTPPEACQSIDGKRCTASAYRAMFGPERAPSRLTSVQST